MKNHVVVVDDHASVRQMLGIVLEREGPYEMVAEAGNGFQALKECRRYLPQIVVLDLLLPELNGLEVLRTLRGELRDTRFMVYSGTLNRNLIVEALQMRPHGFVHKADALPVFCEALRAVAGGCCYFTPFAMKLMDDRQPACGLLSRLTDRERAVLQMIAEGLSNKKMSSRLCIATKTVEHHRAQVMQKLGIHDVATLTRYAIRLGLVTVEV
jgi:DNA-binding NarL/FixJ family response regulator